MAKRKSDSPQKAALREMMSTYMKENNVLPKMERMLILSCLICLAGQRY